MGLCKKPVVLLVLVMVMAVCGVSMGAVYKVGDSAGWTNTDHLDYKSWSSTKTFHVGDTILFEYNKQFQNVIRVTHKNFNACNATGAYFSLSTGNDSFIIPRTGHFYFICSLPGHCEAGQKVDIRVPKTSPPPPSTPARLPSPVPISAPSPSPSGGVSPSPSAAEVPAPHNSASLVKGLLSGATLWLSVLVVLALSFSGSAY
ncbi:hypothetical protein U1Q18_044420 [Sarracenia purpurea var. burkii]